MSTVESAEMAQARVSKQAVAKQFVRLYYSILNTHNGFLYQFYGKNSTVTVRETLTGREALTESAEDETAVKELLQSLYVDVSVKVDSAVPQFSTDNTVLLHINGTMHRKSMDIYRPFTQAFVLYPQENGYYIRTDVVHVLGYTEDRPLLSFWNQEAWAHIQGAPSNRDAASEMSGEEITWQLGSFQGQVPDDIATSRDLRTATPPLEDTPKHHLPNKVHESDHESEEQALRKQPQPWIMRPQGSKTSANTHSAMMVPPVMMAPPMAVAPPLHVPTASMAFPMPVGPPAAARYLRQRSMSMGCDPWSAQTQMGHGVFIARLPFGIQPADVEEAFSQFGPILGGRDGIQVRDGRNGCYAFVTFENADSARTAIQQGAVLQGKRVFIEPRYPRQEPEAALVAYPTMMPTPMPYTMHAAPRHIPRMP